MFFKQHTVFHTSNGLGMHIILGEYGKIIISFRSLIFGLFQCLLCLFNSVLAHFMHLDVTSSPWKNRKWNREFAKKQHTLLTQVEWLQFLVLNLWHFHRIPRFFQRFFHLWIPCTCLWSFWFVFGRGRQRGTWSNPWGKTNQFQCAYRGQALIFYILARNWWLGRKGLCNANLLFSRLQRVHSFLQGPKKWCLRSMTIPSQRTFWWWFSCVVSVFQPVLYQC